MADVGSKRAGIKVQCYQTVQDDIMGVRIWRVG